MTSAAHQLAAEGAHPTSWDDFIGQDATKRQLRIAAKSARMRGARMGHTLLASPTPGIGKTSLALLVAFEIDRPVHAVSGKMSAAEVRVMFSQMSDGDILFIDEVHRLTQGGKAGAEWLLHYLQNGVLMGPLGPEEAPQVTIVAATTDAGRLPQPVLERFELAPTLADYTEDEGARIAAKIADKVLPDELNLPSTATADAVARAASNSPRIMRRLLCAVRDLALIGEIETTIHDDGTADYDLTEALAWCGLTSDGLTQTCQDYLRICFTELRGQAAGAALLAERLGTVGGGLAETERLLLDKGLIAKTKGGRMLTAAGIKRARDLVTR